jgi:hypothetical protein
MYKSDLLVAVPILISVQPFLGSTEAHDSVKESFSEDAPVLQFQAKAHRCLKRAFMR